jgi:ornithine cyclodeaminase/alanine dehydrogenase-like protein (mu-crystallin family)
LASDLCVCRPTYSDAAKDEVGDLIEPLASGLIRQENIVHIADLVVGKRSIDTARTTVFKSVGLALYDLYAAQAFCAKALRLGRGTLLNIQRETPQL